MAKDDPADEVQREPGAGPDSFEALLRSAARTSAVLRVGANLAGRRFQIVRVLGQGGMGTVYEAQDASRAGRVALKTLTRCRAQDLYRLKNEFRSLADVAHPNLVALHEFICDDNLWFFTMDLLRGEDFRSYVRGPELGGLAQTRAAAEPEFDEGRLRSALAQLVQGVVALHQAGKLHCDLKPANVMVSQTGQLKILDFGLVSERVGPSSGRTLGPEWAGTPGYMAPEQMEAREPSPATDYYAIGVMLYESLTGRLPFRGTGGPSVRWPDRPLPELPSQLSSGSTADLAELCLQLLAFDASMRPSEQSLLERVGRAGAPGPRASVPKVSPNTSFVGREGELAKLRAMQASLEPATPQAALIHGPSGIGKTRLAQEFLRTYCDDSHCVVLEGRCYERESVPYNAFDSLIDALSRYLRRLPDVRAATLMPRDAQLLADLFPVLRRVAAIDVMPSPSRVPTDPLALRRRAFDALKELLSRISDISPLILCIDDMQWADADSVQLLEAIVSGPGAPRMLLVGLHLIEHANVAASIADLCARQHVSLTDLVLEPLEERATLALIHETLDLSESDAKRMAFESKGNPFFLGELIAAGAPAARASEACAGAQPRGATDLRDVIVGRAAKLSPSTRGLLDLLCIARVPLELGTALQAAGLVDLGQRLVTELRNERWLRLDPAGQGQHVEIYHEHIRRVLFDTLGPEQRQALHRRLAECMEAHAAADEELVAMYWLEAGAVERAAAGFARAARGAEKNLAFASAGRLYGLALEHGSFERREAQRLRLSMAASYERLGQALFAANVYLEAASVEESTETALALRRTAAQLLLASGSLEAGTDVLRSVLIEVGLDYPERPDEAQLWLDAARQELATRALGEGEVERETALAGQALAVLQRRADACWAAGPALGSYDFVRAGYFAARGLLLALDTGDDLRIARGLAMYATSVASSGDTALAQKIAARSLALATRVSDRVAMANAELVIGQVCLFAGDFAACLDACDRAGAMFRSEHAGESLEIHLCNMFANMALHMSGRLDELVRRSNAQLVDARDRGHIQAEASLRVLGVALGHMANDDVGLARQQGEISAKLWPQDQFHGERFKVLRLEIWCDMYEGHGERALQRFIAAREQAQESRLLSSRYWSFWWFDLAAAVALSAASCVSAGAAREPLIAEASEALLKLQDMEPKYVRLPLVAYRAARAHLLGDRSAARDGLRALCSAERPILAACAQAKLGATLGGPEGAALKELGLRNLGPWVKCPERWIHFTLPGFAAPSA